MRVQRNKEIEEYKAKAQRELEQLQTEKRELLQKNKVYEQALKLLYVQNKEKEAERSSKPTASTTTPQNSGGGNATS